MKKIFLLAAVLYYSQIASAQITFHALVKDSVSGNPLHNVNVLLKGTNRIIVSDSSGNIVFKSIPVGKHSFLFSQVGYNSKTIEINFPLVNPDSVVIIFLPRAEIKLDEVIISSGRTESGIGNTPTRVEVLGAEELDEEVSLKPNNIASLLGDIAGIQTQITSATTGNTELKVQGLPGKYTQLLRDGMPLFGSYSGSFSILQMPPLDLKQLEIIKGSVSTLYGCGAIAGMINIISKKPKEGVFEKTILLNQTTLQETNANVYLSNRKKKIGYTFFTGVNHQNQVDVNNDGFSDAPHLEGYFLHPVLFIYPNEKNVISIGYNGVFENRKGGDMQVLENKTNGQHQYFDKDNSHRHTADINFENKISNSDKLVFKSTASWFDRKIETNVFGMKARQLSYYTELSYLKRTKKDDIVIGANFNGEDFKKDLPDSSMLKNYNFTTIGIFGQDDWRITKKITIESGYRFDHHNIYGNFFLPRFSILCHLSADLTTRLGGGLGYAIPTAFNSEIDERDYKQLLPPTNLKAEKSTGANWDINYHHHSSEWDITVNQTFYITRINHPVIDSTLPNGSIGFYNALKPISTSGFETYVQLKQDELEIYLGYTYTVAKKSYDQTHPYLSLSAKNKFASLVSYEFSKNFQAGVEYSITGKQWLDNGNQSPSFPIAAAMLRYTYNKFTFVLNCENIFDYRQSKKQTIVMAPYTNPSFAQIWAPIEGRVANLSVRIKL